MLDICGIDEAGRGSLAGPLVVAGVQLKSNIDNITDSKKITPKKREHLYDMIISSSDYHIVFIDNKYIDKNGLTKSTQTAIYDIMKKVDSNNYIFDGNTTLGISNLSSVIKGDLKVKPIGAASILAKVSRDRYMCSIDSSYLNFSFCRHKGYGTKIHLKEILDFGYCDIHRQSFNIKSFKEV
jgi:ribonuclease HII